jgi:hypothetical protein
MKPLLQHLTAICMATGLFAPAIATAQIDYFQDFSTDGNNWTTTDFDITDVATCDNPYAFRAAYKNYADAAVPAITLSPRLGISNGEQLVLSYNYKVLLYDNVLPYQPANGNNWGSLTVEYGTTPNGPWTIVDNITSKNHVPVNACTPRKLVFIPPNGSAVYLRIAVGNGSDYANGYYVYIDDISVLQDNITTGPTVATSAFKVYPNPVSDYLTIEYPGAISSLQIFNNQGEAVSVENIGNDYSRLDLSGLQRGNYTLKITGDNDEVTTVNLEKREVN